MFLNCKQRAVFESAVKARERKDDTVVNPRKIKTKIITNEKMEKSASANDFPIANKPKQRKNDNDLSQPKM